MIVHFELDNTFIHDTQRNSAFSIFTIVGMPLSQEPFEQAYDQFPAKFSLCQWLKDNVLTAIFYSFSTALILWAAVVFAAAI